MKKKKLTFVIPVFNEAANIPPLLKGITSYVKTPYIINFIYDTNTDPTINAIKKWGKGNKDIRLVKNKYGIGVIKALKTGLEESQTEYVCIMMADLSDNPKDVDKMVKKLDSGADFVSGSRYSRGGKRVGGPKIKGGLSRIGSTLLNRFSGINTLDATNAFKCFRREILKDIKIESTGGFELPLELTVKAYRLGYKIDEVPTVWKERIHGTSKFKLLKWLPSYFKWFLYGVKNAPSTNPQKS